jgi:hypothetical protein
VHAANIMQVLMKDKMTENYKDIRGILTMVDEAVNGL